jgi:hypothetical protein
LNQPEELNSEIDSRLRSSNARLRERFLYLWPVGLGMINALASANGTAPERIVGHSYTARKRRSGNRDAGTDAIAVARCPSNRGRHRAAPACLEWHLLVTSRQRLRAVPPIVACTRRNPTADRRPSWMPHGGGEDLTCWLLGLPWRLGAPDLQEFGGQVQSQSDPLPSHQEGVRRVRACLAATLKPEQHR